MCVSYDGLYCVKIEFCSRHELTNDFTNFGPSTVISSNLIYRGVLENIYS